MKGTVGVVSAPHALAAEVGAGVLQRGGNAFDAAVAVALAIGITQPYHSGLGGGCNITFMDATGKAGHINARGPAPQALTRDLFFEGDAPDYTRVRAGGLAVTIPSLVAGLEVLHQGRGRLPWLEVCLAPLSLASEGFTADFMLANVYRRGDTAEKIAHYAQDTPFAEPIREGQRVVQPRLAETLTVIARDPRAVYEGDIARQLVAAVQRSGGVLSLEDLASYQPRTAPLREFFYRGWRVLVPGLPTIGALQTGLALGVLSRFDLSKVAPGSAQHLHLIAETVKATYRVRAEVDNAEAAQRMMNEATVERLAADIRLDSVHSETFGRAVPPGESCTSHLCVADRDGNVVSQTQTIRSHFGSGVCDTQTGVVLNDSVGDFSLQPGEVTTQGISYRGNYNLLSPGTEPASSQSPLIAFHPKSGDIIAAGAAGGPRIVSATLQALTNQIDFGVNAQVAVALPRVHNHGAATDIEPDSPVAEALSVLGHRLETPPSMGVAQTLRRRGGVWEGGADPRGPGGVCLLIEDGDYTTVRRYGTSYPERTLLE